MGFAVCPVNTASNDNMAIWINFVEWLYANVRIPKDGLVKMLDKLDADSDGYITVGEAIRAIKAWIGE